MYSILCDFDGTLIKSDRTIDKDALITLKKLLIDNHFCIVSQSSISELLTFINYYDINCDLFSLSSNILFINGEYQMDLIDSKLLNRIITKYKNNIYTLWSETVNKTYIYNYNERVELIYPKINRTVVHMIPENLCEVTVAINNEVSESFKQEILDNNLYYSSYAKDKHRELLMIYKHKIDKSYAIEVYKDYYNDKKIVGISDSYSDIDFISQCDIKIAMKNADEKLKNNVEYITPLTNNESGAIKFLDYICHLK